MSKSCVFAGTFDPPTVGHKDVIESALKIFDKVTVAVMINAQKDCLFTKDERLNLLQKLYESEPRVKVRSFDDAAFYVRGVRDIIDFEYENRNHYASKKLMDDMVTIYIPAEQGDMHISSTLIRNSVKFNKDFMPYIPPEIQGDIKKLLEAKNV